jgi:hypothetical protein
VIVEPGPAGVLPLADQHGCPSEIRDGPGAQRFKIIPLSFGAYLGHTPSPAQRLDREPAGPTAGIRRSTRGFAVNNLQFL